MTPEAAQVRTLARATFDGFFESELVTPGPPQIRLIVFGIVALMFPATSIPLRAAQAYHFASIGRPEVLDLVMWPHKLLFITLAMFGTAVVSLIIWDNVFPDRRDAFVIGHLPIRTRTVVAARLLAIAALMGLMALGTSLPSAILYGGMAGAFSGRGVIRGVIAHAATTMGASMFAFLLLLTLQGVLINLVPGRWLQRAMVLLQFVFVSAALQALLFMAPMVEELEQAMAPGAATQAAWMAWAPPGWFLALYETIGGSSRPVHGLALRAVVSLLVLLPGAFGVYAFTYRRLTRRAVEARDTERIGGGVGREPVGARIGALLTRSPVGRAVCRFAVLTVLRNRRHRLLLTIFAGIGTTAAVASILIPYSRERLASLAAPEGILPLGMVLAFFLVVGLRTLFAVPAEPSANWIFKLSDAEDARLHVRGAVAAMVSVGVVPVIALLMPLHLFTQGILVTVLHSAVMLAAGFLLAEVVLNGIRRVPFTCAYTAHAARARVMWPVWLAGFVAFCFGLTSIERQLLGNPIGAAVFVATLAAAAVVLRWAREREYRLASRMLSFDEGAADALVTLELHGAIPWPARPPAG